MFRGEREKKRKREKERGGKMSKKRENELKNVR